jgi:fluoroacetyl-CoA thioesterase
LSDQQAASPDLPIGATASAIWTVAESDLASRLSSEHGDAFPAVFATARMVALMELAAARVLAPFLKEGERSVGISIDVSHTAATPPGAVVTAEARFGGLEGKRYKFYIVARDDGGEIGRAVHERAVVDESRLVEGARRRCRI